MAERIYRIPTLLADYFPCGHTHFHEFIKPRLVAAGGRVQLGERVIGFTETSVEIVQKEMKAEAEGAPEPTSKASNKKVKRQRAEAATETA